MSLRPVYVNNPREPYTNTSRQPWESSTKLFHSILLGLDIKSQQTGLGCKRICDIVVFGTTGHVRVRLLPTIQMHVGLC